MEKELLEYFNNDELAASVWTSKYKQKGDKTPDCMHKRMAKEFARIEKSYGEKEHFNLKDWHTQSEYGRKRRFLSYDHIYNLFKDFKYIVPQGSVMSVLGVEGLIASLSNCFVLGQPHDSYGGIMQKDEEQAQLMKRRGGVGLDVSTLRPAGTPTSNAAKSSTGAISFMPRFSSTTREVAQNGRRGALMLSIAERHPDIFDFVKIKRDLSQVTGANISIKLHDDFMLAVDKDEDFILRFPVDSKLEDMDLTPNWDEPEYGVLKKTGGILHKRIRARELWDEIIKSARDVAEPGLMFWDTMVNYSPDGVYDQYKAITTNPCSEIGMQAYDACRLIAVNFFSFVVNPFTKDAYFDFDKFYEVNYEAMRLSDDLVDLELEHIDRILEKIDSDPEPDEVKLVERNLWLKIKKTASASRRTGLGFTALGDALAALGLKYDSDEALETIENIMHCKMKSELNCTTDMAITRGTFERWNNDLEFNHRQAKCQGKNSFYQFIAEQFPDQAEKMVKYGRRNVSWSTSAPTGSLSILTRTSSGIEPLFSGYYMRRKKINPNDENTRVDFVDQSGDSWQEFPVLHPKFKDWLMLYSETDEKFREEYVNSLPKESLEKAFKMSPWYKATANDINWVRRVEIQGIAQKYITHSISSTVNLPEDVSYEEVSEIYLKAYDKGLKGITVYRDGSRSGVMVSNDKKKTETSFEYVDAVKRPKSIKAEGHTTNIKGEKFNVVVGLLDNKPYEIFMFPYIRELGKGEISKIKRGVYDYRDSEKNLVIQGLSSHMTDEQAAITRLTSTSLRHGADIKFIVEQLTKADGGLFSFTKGLARILKKYIPEGAKSTVTCQNPDCTGDGTNVIFEEGCHSCKDCGSSKCG